MEPRHAEECPHNLDRDASPPLQRARATAADCDCGLDQLRVDKERLDWLEAKPSTQHESLSSLMTLRLLRESHCLSPTQLARLSGVSVRTIWNVERRPESARYDTRRKLLTALETPFEEHREVFKRLPQREIRL